MDKKIKLYLCLAVMTAVIFACMSSGNNPVQSDNPAAGIEDVASGNQASVEAGQESAPAAESSGGIASGRYVYTNQNVVRDLVEKDGIIYAATLGGLTIWDMSTNTMVPVPTVGMGHISANAVAYCEIPEPRILVGTLKGVSVFDPAAGQWEQRDLFPEDSYISTNEIDRIYCDQANNRILVGYAGLGVLDMNTGAFQHYTSQDALLWNAVADIAVNGQDIWIATGYKGVSKISNGQVTNFTEAEGMQDEGADALAFTSDGTLWVGTGSGLIAYNGSVWELYESDLSSINEIEVISDSSFWVTTASWGGGRLCEFDIASASCVQDFEDVDYAIISALTTTPMSEPIYGTSEGISVLKSGASALEQLKTSDKLVTNYVDALAVGPDGMLWVGTDGGVQVLDPAAPSQPWTTYQEENYENMGGNWASSIAFSADGGVWMAIINGSATHYLNGQWQSFPDIYSFELVTLDAQDRAWFADAGEGIVVLGADGNQVMTLTTADGLPSDNVRTLLLDNNGTMWIGTGDGLAKYENDTLTVVFGSESTEIPNTFIPSLALDQNGDLLIGTYTSVSRYDGQSVTTLIDFYEDGFNNARLTNLACNSKGELWIGTDSGVIYGTPGSGWSMMTTENGLLTNYISALTVDQYDTVWIGGGGSNFDGGGLVQIVP